MTDRTLQQPWSQPGWLDQASTWIERTLQGQAIRLTGPIDQVHQVPWSTVLRVPTSEGDVYFKAPMSVLVHEAALTQALSQWRPDCSLPLLAVELERGWMLVPDGGTRLREVIRAEGDSRPWEVVLPTYAALQMDMVSRREELLTVGVPDRGLAVLPSRFEELLADEWVLGIGQPDRLTRDEVEHLRQLVPGRPRCAPPEGTHNPQTAGYLHARIHGVRSGLIDSKGMPTDSFARGKHGLPVHFQFFDSGLYQSHCVPDGPFVERKSDPRGRE